MLSRRHFIAASAGAFAAPFAIGRALARPDKAEVLYDADAPVLGNPKGDITIVEYFDYRCPYCRKGYAAMMDLVRQDGNLRLVMKDWPIFGDASVTAAQAALGAASFGRYADAVEALITARGLKTDDDVMAALAAAGIDEAKLTKAVNDGIDKINGLLDRNYRQADGFGFDGTPSYVIETAVFRGALDADALRTMIGDARKAKAKAKADAPI
jgi:protein-disulfide isomerase